MEPILEIPEHIKALPEPEQGPALVKAIHDRKLMTHETGVIRGPKGLQVWIDEAQEWKDAYAPSAWSDVFDMKGRLVSTKIEFQCTDVSDEFMALMMGYNSTEEMLEERRKRQKLWDTVSDVLSRKVDAPPVDVDSVRWPAGKRKLIAPRPDEWSALNEMLGIKGE